MVAIIVTYRNRFENLRTLLPVLKLYAPPSCIFIAEQTDDGPFSRALLINAMFANMPLDTKVALTDIVIHDVDMIPIVWDISPCKTLAHLITRMSTEATGYKWGIPYEHYFGGSAIINADTFVKLDGFNNAYRGWGCEDDDFIYHYLTNALKLGMCTYDDAAVGRFERRTGLIYHMYHESNGATSPWFTRNLAILDKRVSSRFTPDGYNGLKAQKAVVSNIAIWEECWRYGFKLPPVPDLPI